MVILLTVSGTHNVFVGGLIDKALLQLPSWPEREGKFKIDVNHDAMVVPRLKPSSQGKNKMAERSSEQGS